MGQKHNKGGRKRISQNNVKLITRVNRQIFLNRNTKSTGKQNGFYREHPTEQTVRVKIRTVQEFHTGY